MSEVVKFDLTKRAGGFKPLNATNGGPLHKRHANDQARSNFADYKAARIPYSRNHDSAFHSIYGGPYSHDITCIFPRFEADPYDPASYDFACTDESILTTLEAGTETFFRLGQSIEHQIKKHGTIPPADFSKWAVICEHIIRHYNEGWADGFELGIKYWEIWNEPDLDADDSKNKRTWGGTRAQFFDFYETAARHLKKCFPQLKIGGPAMASIKGDWCDCFLSEMKRRGIELDFFSWHIYTTDIAKITFRANLVRELLDKYGYGDTESILNEWNYVRGWTDDYVYSIKAIHGAKGASFLLAAICASARAPIDMLMYYDTRPSVFNGAFDLYTYEPLKGYYAMYWYGQLYDMEAEIVAENTLEDIYTVCGVDREGSPLLLLSYYSENDDAPDRTVHFELGEGEFEVCLVAPDREETFVTRDTTLTLKVHSIAKIRKIK